jgi:hypothetical protein
MGLFGGGAASKYWRSPTWRLPPGGGRPIWLSVWTRGPVGGAHNNGPATFGISTGGTGSVGFYFDGAGGLYVWDQNDGGSFAQGSGGPAVLNTWQHYFGFFPSLSTRFNYLNGVQTSQENTTLALPQTLDCFIVGTLQASYLDTNRLVAEAVFGRGNVDISQIQQLAQGANPLAVLPKQILAYFPLRGDLRDLGPRQAGLMPIGGAVTLFGEHPPVALPPRRRLLPGSGAVVVPPPTGNPRPRITMVA